MAAAAAAFSSTTPAEKKYDVFISFKGADTRDNILSHLHAALCRAKVETFIDNDLRRGDDVSEALLRTIEESKMSIVIFSKNYAASRWCLDELLKIMECNEKNALIVIPVFFKVDPSHVRKQSGSFAQALAQHEDHPKIQRWRDALTKAANLSGWDSQIIRPEATLIKNMVSDILGKLYYTSSSTFGSLVGMSSHFEQIDMILSTISEEVRIIGFWGMGGIGKSTLARAFFNHVFSQFEGHCIIEDIRETCEKHGLNNIREKLLTGILKDENLNVGTPNLGIPSIMDRLRRKKVLIVLDDLNNVQHIELLVGRRECLGRGSIIIITSRDKQVLKSGVDRIYEVPGLDYHEALCLFGQYAFKQKHPRDGHHMRLSNRAINYAKGHPLALKILGSYLFGRSNEEQESALDKLERTPNMDVQKVLRISYDGLDNEEKNIFLNIACFFKGGYTDEVKCFHDSGGYSTDIGIRVLMDKSLITIRMGRVWMHDLLQKMGREIVREESIEEPGKRSRLWDHHDISHVLTKNTGTEAVKGIILDLHNIRSFSIKSAAFETMHSLEFLKIKVDLPTLHLPQGLGYLPSELRYMYWDRYPLTYLPSNFHLENLVRLIMPHSHVEQLWNGRQDLAHLNMVDLSYSTKLIEIPDLSLATNLQNLVLTNCKRLKNLPGSLASLKTLNLNGCSHIKKFPEVSTKIEYLNLGWTAIEEVPSSIDCFTSLFFLNLGECKRLKKLPKSIYKLKPLRYFGLYLPYNKRELLQEVNIHLRELSDHLVWLSAVEFLKLSGNHFQELPVAIKQLNNLQYLYVDDCKRLQSLPQLPMNVQRIYARNCISLETVATPLTTATRGEFTSVVEYIVFNFFNCLKLNQNAQNSIVADAELKLMQWEATCPETFSQKTKVAGISFMGGDIPDWFNYKSMGSSLTAKLPKNWCNAELFCLVFSVVLEFKDFPRYGKFNILKYDCHIRNNIGDNSSGKGWFNLLRWGTKDAIQSNHVLLSYGKSLINDWRTKPKEAGDDGADVISIELYVGEDSKNCCKIKECGIHLLYRHDTDNGCSSSTIECDSPGSPNQFSFNPDCMDDGIEETVIGDSKRNGGGNGNCSNMGNLMEYSVAVRRKKMRK
ncbi:disease resistance-like protein DSC1 isoform X1 [Tripterygium wilfordii]|uniref:disease resistance-like protein DSC1 isoform X1 n=2 Tax=Tripterygium wilfordii TaxID=458696 RepID=UPI0018F82CE6|nr:disease resistance-like protein DSC1 isoform X1 [Tripterygium wilfordii]